MSAWLMGRCCKPGQNPGVDTAEQAPARCSLNETSRDEGHKTHFWEDPKLVDTGLLGCSRPRTQLSRERLKTGLLGKSSRRSLGKGFKTGRTAEIVAAASK